MEAGKIKVEAPSVVVDVIVTDKKGRPASGLTAGDFAVSDNDVPQKIVTFVPPLAPNETPGSKPATAPEKTNAAPSTTTASARQLSTEREARDLASVHFITLVMDTGDLQPGNIPRATHAAAEYIQKVIAPDDFVAVYWIDQSLHLALPFTQDKPKAVEAIQKLGSRVPEGRMTALMRIETEQEINDLEGKKFGFMSGAGPGAGEGGTGDIAGAGERELASLRAFLWTQSTLQAKAVFVAMRAIAQAYRDLPGRENVVVFSEGFMHSPEAAPAMQAVIEAANRANVAFYIIDTAGLTAGFSATSHGVDASVEAKISEMGAEGAPVIMPEGLDQFQFIQQVGTDILHDDLGQVASATGGFYVKNQNDLLRGLKLADRDLREFYTLVYQPTDTNYDGSFHRIRVALLKPGYHVRYRMGYWAVPPGEEMMVTPAAAQLLGALASGSLRPAFKPEVNAVVLLASDGKLAAPVHVALPAKSAGFVKDKDKNTYRAGITLMLAAYDHLGHLVSVHQRFVDLNLDPKQWKQFEHKTLDINARLAIPTLEPLEIEAILQFADGTVALARRAIPIAEPSASGIRLTSLLLSDDIQPASGASDPSDPLRGPNFELHLPVEPRFSPSDKLSVYFGILEGSLEPAGVPPHVRLSYTIKSGGSVVEGLPAEEVGGGGSRAQNRMLVLKQFDLKNLRPGAYTVEVRAEDLDHRVTASQDADFIVG
ncbi:MAG TPA: VWA domain-containing protein [Terriglobia bacterium]|nr:VWA domain-containing protein [Terriglobia bacterium]